MAIGSAARTVGWVWLLWLAAGSWSVAQTADSSAKATAATVTPLDLAPSQAHHSAADTDTKPSGALSSSSRKISGLDFSPPPGFLPDLPSETLPPAFEAPAAADVGLPSTILQPQAATTASLLSVPTASSHDPTSEPKPLSTTAAPPANPLEPVKLAPTATNSAAPLDREVTPDPQSEALANAIHSVLDRFVAVEAKRRPVGASDWSVARKAIAAVYAERAYAPFWIDSNGWNTPAKSVLARLAKADEDGLDLAATPPPPIDHLDAATIAQASADIALSASVVAYALQAGGARVSPRALSKDISAKPLVADPAAALKEVAFATDPDAALASYNPPQQGYRDLRAALADVRAASERPIARLSPGPVLTLGMSDPRVPLVRARFGLGPLSEAKSLEVYDVRVASAVASFQRVHGLPINGSLTTATATALDGIGAQSRQERLIIANMEMWRWQPREMGEIRVEVNVPAFSLNLLDGERVLLRTRVIVGKPDTPTPIFSNSIKYMLFNPVWHIPESIVKNELAPKYAADPNYFERHGYKVSYSGDKMEVEQPPGEANALGRMLFLFPNEYAVYLHDTPSRSLFSASYRALSHGCVRVEDPSRLAEALMGGQAKGWTAAKVHSLLGDKERTFSLPTAVPVHLQYFTEFVEGGTLRERDDIYGLTGKVALALASLRRD